MLVISEASVSSSGKDMDYETDLLLLLLKEVAGNFPSCKMLKEEYVREHVLPPSVQFMGGRDRNRGQREANPANQPAREPTEEEIDIVMTFVGY